MAHPRITIIASGMLALLCACGTGQTTPPPVGDTSPCQPAELLLPDGRCVRPGIPPDGCATGFAHDGEYGCVAVLPEAPCPAGLMAVPGEQSCREVAACGTGRWGDVPTDAATEHVDAAYPGTDSEGSAERPWRSIGVAVAAAAPGAVVAVAAGSYVEDVVIDDVPVMLWGKCPAEVEIVGTGGQAGAVALGAAGSSVRALAIRGAAIGIRVHDTEQVVVDRVWVHDTASVGINVKGSKEVSVTGSLVEQTRGYGVAAWGAELAIEGTVVRGSAPDGSGDLPGRGIHVQVSCPEGVCDPSARSTAAVRGSLVEQNHDVGLSVAGSDAVIERTVVRDTLPHPASETAGRGIDIQVPCTPAGCDPSIRPVATVRDSLLARNHDVGLYVLGSDVVVEGTIVRDTVAAPNGRGDGHGISIENACAEPPCVPGARSVATVRGSLVEHNRAIGLFVQGSDATIEQTVVRGTLPRASDQRQGRGLHIQLWCDDDDCDPGARANATVRDSLVASSFEAGVLAHGSDLVVEDTFVRDTLPAAADGRYGDGVAVASAWASWTEPATASLTNTAIEQSARAGLGNYGAAVALGGTATACAAFDLDGETYFEHAFSFAVVGENRCGCPAALGECVAASAGLSPPEAVTTDR